MMEKARRFLAVLLTICMVFTTQSVTLWASEVPQEETILSDESVADEALVGEALSSAEQTAKTEDVSPAEQAAKTEEVLPAEQAAKTESRRLKRKTKQIYQKICLKKNMRRSLLSGPPARI